jgi:multidrug efflux system membrane fusion protein
LGGAVVLLFLTFGYAFYGEGAKPASKPAAGPPAAAVTVRSIVAQTIRPFAEFSGRINAVDFAEIRPQVSGRITKIRFHDGQKVTAGDVLLVIDPRPYQAAVAKAEADLATAVNNAKLAEIERNRGSQLVKTNALSQDTYDQRVTADAVARASVQSAAAALDAAKLNVDYAFVKAPISGRISRAEITLGNLVGSPTAPPPLLASIVSEGDVYADFEVDEQTYLTVVRSYGLAQSQQQSVPVELFASGDSAHIYHGSIESFDNKIDRASGTIRARARFDNTDGALVPGMFVSVRMGIGALNDAIVVPESTIGNDQNKRFVFVVGAGNKAEYRAVQLGPQMEGNRVVAAGLKVGDQLIVDGLQRLAPGAPVLPQTVASVAFSAVAPAQQAVNRP